MHLPASRVAATVLAGRPALLHHHDPPWQRERFAHVDELPATDPAWRHVVINERTRAEFADRGIDAVTVYNGFDTEAPPGDRRATRATLGVGDHELLIVHPVRAIARKNIGAAVALAEAVGATYWLTGPAEEDFAPELERILATAGTRVLHRPCARQADLYAACDLVVFPSTWEGFGNPPVEAAIARRPVLVGEYPVADELRALGFDWPRFVAVDDATVAEARRWLIDPDRTRIEHNHEVAKQELGLGVMSRRLQSVLEQAGWRP
jgi:mannosylglucosylglycerate synthase